VTLRGSNAAQAPSDKPAATATRTIRREFVMRGAPAGVDALQQVNATPIVH
jgi:hypothetical protein